jgi:3-oxoacyl-[acyl-carrier-protein] synthase-3
MRCARRPNGSDIDLIVLATATPDHTFPQPPPRCKPHLAQAVLPSTCKPFAPALFMPSPWLITMIRLGQAKRAVVIGAETFSRLLDWNDRTTCVLFGDGAGAVVLQAAEGRGDKWDRGVLSTHIHSDGNHYDLLCTNGGASSTQTSGFVQMQGQEVFKHAVRHLSEVVDEALSASKIEPSELDLFVPHQANQRIIDAVARKLNMDEKKVVLTVGEHGNTSAASIPLALSHAVEQGRLKPGHLVLTDAMGAGFTWGAAMIRW